MIISYVFLPHLFSLETSNYLRLNRKYHIPSMSTVGLVFFLARAYQHKTNKIRITIFALPQLKICILQDGNKFKSTYLAQFNSPRKKHTKQQVSYFYQIVHFMMNLKKFSKPNLDTPSLSYKFHKLVFKSRKNKEKQTKP